MTVLLAAAAATAAVDAVSKQLVIARLVEGRLYALAPGWGLRRVHNRDGTLGALSVRQSAMAWVAVAGCVAIVLAASPAVGALAAAGLGMVVGGAAGNIGDRLVRHGVVDFVAAGPWPVFNLADAAMTTGLVLAVVGVV